MGGEGSSAPETSALSSSLSTNAGIMTDQPKPSDFYPGARIGHFKLLGRVRVPDNAPYNLRIKWRVECTCGNVLNVFQYYMLRKKNPKTNCGCLRKTEKTIYNQEYRIWCMMRQRCYSPDHVAYKHYGGRGIKIADEWLGPEGFKNFLAHIGPRPSPGHSVDRKNVDGNYEPGNVRWATAVEQAANKRTT